MSVELVLVDFDDTIVDTAPRFQNARRSLFALIAEAGVPADLAEYIHQYRVDPEMLAVHGLGPARLEYSFRATYEAACAELKLPPEPGLADRCAALGLAVAGTPPILPGALEALRVLGTRYRTVLYTQGADPGYQMGCVRESGVVEVVGESGVRVCRQKTAEAFRETLEVLGGPLPASVWMVGNSIRSDVNPALEAGANAILVEVADPWEYDQVPPVSDDFLRVPSFAAAVEYLVGRGA